jgi:hypothetical protein
MTASLSEIIIIVYQTKWRRDMEYHSMNLFGFENFKYEATYS